MIADVFKIVNDPFVGKLGVFRVWQGTIRRDTQLFIDDNKKPFKVGHLFRLRGKTHEEIDRAIPGDIAAIAKVEEIHFDAVLHDSHDEDSIHLSPMQFPQPMFGLALEPKHKGQEQKLSQALARLAEEDPCFRVEHHKELNETVVRGLSDLHLKVMLERMKERYGVEVTTHPPRIAYRETIAGHAEGHHRHKKQTGGAGQFGEVFLRVEPLDRGAGFEFVDAVKGGVDPRPVSARHRERRAPGAGNRRRRRLPDPGSARDRVRRQVPSGGLEGSGLCQRRQEGLSRCRQARRAPSCSNRSWTSKWRFPRRSVGDVTGGLASKRARILGTDSLRGGELVIKAQAPLAELTDYPTELKAMTGGRGRYSLDLSHYEPVPSPVQKQLTEAWKPHLEED